ncbi:MAG: NgoPII family restriction endonuclease [Pseudanabaenaceae cyanobacterium bins.39]|nr:NgoPII family restriction endonuclease [Pseudanabaenaceae cyanobacterium bins.39]
MIYAIGVVPKTRNNLKTLWLIYGDCFAADKNIYERIRNGVCEGINQIEGIEFALTNEIARVNKVDPLGITYLRVRGMWGIENPINVFNYLNLNDYLNNNFSLICILQKQKYLSLPANSIKQIQELHDQNILTIKDIQIKSPNNPANLLEAKTIIYTID